MTLVDDERACRETFPDGVLLDALTCPRVPPVSLDTEALRPLTGAVAPGESVVLVVSDQTRKTGLDEILPLLWSRWRAAGVRRTDLSLLVACGSHRGPTSDELRTILGASAHKELADRVVVHDGFTSPCTRLGVTTRGTPVEIADVAVRADAVVTVGTVLFHYFAGLSGGPKSIVPGIASSTTIAANHSLTIDREGRRPDPRVQIGRLQGNPVAEDLREAAALLPVRASVQTVRHPHGYLAGVFVGRPAEAHRLACETAVRVFGCPVARKADLVVARAGPARTWLQSHKSLVNASRAVNRDGVIVLIAPCSEGVGSESLSRWLARGTPEEVIAGISGSADINGQTALSTMVRGRQAVLVSQLPESTAREMHMQPARTLEAGLRAARTRLGCLGVSAPRVRCMPEAWVTVPLAVHGTQGVRA